MAGKKSKAKTRRSPRPTKRSRIGGLPGFIGIAAAMALFGGALFYLLGASPDADAPAASSAASTTEGGVRVIEGSVHTVRHTEAPLPSTGSPQTEGLPTLVWFSGTWCQFCHAMSPFAHDTAGEFDGDLVFIEKSVDHDRDAAASFGIRGTPTFVLVDATGDELVRFGYQPDQESFRDAIAEALAVSGG